MGRFGNLMRVFAMKLNSYVNEQMGIFTKSTKSFSLPRNSLAMSILRMLLRFLLHISRKNVAIFLLRKLKINHAQINWRVWTKEKRNIILQIDEKKEVIVIECFNLKRTKSDSIEKQTLKIALLKSKELERVVIIKKRFNIRLNVPLNLFVSKLREVEQ